jgi:small subunit ribosomal protein S19e
MLNETNKSGFCTVKELPAEEFIRGYADYLKKNNQLQMPAWVELVKTSKGKELAPFDPDWLYIRVAAVARKIFLRPRLGVQLLRRLYGGAERRGTIRPTFCKASGKILRWSLKQLENLKVIKKIKKEGEKHYDELKINSRIMSKDGIKNLNRIATEIKKKRTAE